MPRRPRMRPSFVVAIAALSVVMAPGASASPGARALSAPWDSVSTQGNCASPALLGVDLAVGECAPYVTADRMTGSTSSSITISGTRAAHTVAYFTVDVPVSAGASVAEFAADVRVDMLHLGDDTNQVIGMLWATYPNCSCTGWSGQVIVADRARSAGTTTTLTARMTRAAQMAWDGAYRVIVQLVADSTTPAFAGAKRRFDSTTTFTALRVVES